MATLYQNQCANIKTMINKYSVLVLTDHKTHTSDDSIYNLLTCLNNSEWCKSLYVSSRGVDENKSFYSQPDEFQVKARVMDEHLNFLNGDSWFNNNNNNNELNENVDVIIIRVDHPVSDSFLISLKKAFPTSLFINEPEGIIKASGKEYLLQFPALIPYSRLLKSVREVIELSRERHIVIKPLKGYGGKGILRMNPSSFFIGNEEFPLSVAKETIQLAIKMDGGVFVTEYLPNVFEGDNRVLVVNGSVIGSVLRVPKSNSWVCNLSQGGKALPSKVSLEEIEIAKILSEKLNKIGITLFGFDTLVGNDGKRVLSEINVTNVGGFTQLKDNGDEDVFNKVSSLLLSYISENLA